MDGYLVIPASYAFFALLFWQKTKITLPIFLHTVFVGFLIAISFATDNLEVYHPTHHTDENFQLHEFNYMTTITQFFSIPLLCIWNYQWWFIGKEREKIFSHNI